MLDGQYIATKFMTQQHPIFKSNLYNLTTGAEEGWHDVQEILDKIQWRADFDGDGLRMELDHDNDDDGLWDGMEDKNHNGVFEPNLGETSNFNPDRDAPLTSIQIGDPYELDNGLCYIKSITDISLLPGDNGPEEYRGIRNTFYRYYPFGSTSPPNFSNYTTPFHINGSDGKYTLEFYSQDLAGNNENIQVAPVFLDNIPPQVSFYINGYEPYLETNCVNLFTTFSIFTNDTGSGAQAPLYRIRNITTNFDSGWIPYVNQFNLVIPEGEYQIYFNIMDKLGTKAAYTPIPILLDNTPPSTEITLTPPIPNGENGWYTTDVWVSFSCEDNNGGSGIDHIEYSFDNGTTWITPIRGGFPVVTNGEYLLQARSIDNAGNIATPVTTEFKIDKTAPTVTIQQPTDNESIQDTITIIVNTTDETSEVDTVNLTIGTVNNGILTPLSGHEHLVTIYNSTTDRWKYPFDSITISDGHYAIQAHATDTAGNEQCSEIVPFSIRNWAIVELLPECQHHKAGRTVPIKFSIHVAENVDPMKPFVRNEELHIILYENGEPDVILQNSTYGDNSAAYRISSAEKQYITNFKTSKTLKTYMVEIWRNDMLIGSFSFETVK
jgi:hypothetical protein